MQGLSCHLMVEVHLHGVCCNLKYHSRNHYSHAVHHRDSISRYQEVFSDLSVHFKCSLWKVNDPVWFHLAISVCRRKGHVKLISRFHALDMLFELRKQTSCALYIIQRSFLCCVVNNVSVNFEFVCELHYSVLFNFHIALFILFLLIMQKKIHPQKQV